MADRQKLVIILTHGPEDPERATLPFVIGVAALVSEVDVIVALQGGAVLLAREGCADHVFAAGFPPLKKLMDDFREQGGRIFVCGPCVEARQIDKDSHFIPGAEVANAGRLVAEISTATNVVCY